MTIHLIKIDNKINKPTDFLYQCRLSVGWLFPNCDKRDYMGTID